MRPQGSAEELERRRRRAVEAVDQGEDKEDICRILEVSVRSLNRWLQMRREGGEEALAARPQPGRPAYLTACQSQEVLGWVRMNPRDLGFSTELWTAGRLAKLIKDRLGIHFNSRYLSHWLTCHDITCQKPRRVPREKNLKLIEQWLKTVWPKIKKARGVNVHGSW